MPLAVRTNSSSLNTMRSRDDALLIAGWLTAMRSAARVNMALGHERVEKTPAGSDRPIAD